MSDVKKREETYEEKELIAQTLVKRLKICLKIVQSLVIAMLVGVGALVIFVAAASLSGLRESNLSAFFLGVIITGGFSVLCLLGVLVTAVVAYVFLNRLKKLGPTDDKEQCDREDKA